MTRLERSRRRLARGRRWLAAVWRRGRRAGRAAREVTSLGWPIAAAMLGEVGIGLVDTKLVAGLGPAALGGVGIATVLMYLGYSIVFGAMRGVKVRTAYAIGRDRPWDGLRYAQAGALIAFAAGAAIWLAARDATWAFTGLGVSDDVIPHARDFLAARTYGAPAACVMAALIQHRQGAGDSRTPMLVGLAANVVNAALAYALIHGRWGLPALGVAGAGYGTAVTELLQASVMLALLARDVRRSRRERAAEAEPALTLRRAAREVADLGVPTGLHFGLEMLAFTTFTAILAGLGARELAAHHLALNTIRASFLPGVAVAEAASVLVGRSLARRRLDEADRYARAALAIAVGFMTLCGVVFALAGHLVVGLFTDDPEVVAVARSLLLVAALFQTLDAVNMVLRGSLRGAKDVGWVAFVGTTVAWCTIPASALVLGRWLGWGALGGWCGFVLETSIASALLWRRWSRGPWRAPFTTGRDTPEPEVKVAPVAA